MKPPGDPARTLVVPRAAYRRPARPAWNRCAPLKSWVFDPHSGGVPIPPSVQAVVRTRLEHHAAAHYPGRYSRLVIRFRGVFCYMDAYRGPRPPRPSLLRITGESRDEYLVRLRNIPIRLGRLRYFRGDRWSYCFFTYSNEKYKPAVFPSGNWFGSPEEAFDMGATYLTED
jgi:hypothetical protein